MGIGKEKKNSDWHIDVPNYTGLNVFKYKEQMEHWYCSNSKVRLVRQFSGHAEAASEESIVMQARRCHFRYLHMWRFLAE